MKPLLPFALLPLLLSTCRPSPPPPERIAYHIKEVLLLGTYEYTYRDIIYIEDPNWLARLFKVDHPLLFSIVYHIQAGIDLSTLTITRHPTDPGHLIISHEPARILSIDADERAIHEYFGAPNTYPHPRLLEEINRRKPAVEQLAISQGLLEKAQARAHLLVEELLREAGYTTIEWHIESGGPEG
ncbi:hypothetical protein Spith_0117 [Spirochaeta thermophila DSM 6578]|uniref:DUF4230 domain-containing protein n=1 Tax=Winmispira thermophila (strain ATCC 700085 / DSM 6578 / Z-1203) TaxID=869211 RepID=G0GC40_WINT7|nr:DUF4230 domain-containing protein [Spirochaeta thermophila]AEJ60404.1 hypothetical protein Spith_0117 [Spirochaeta thermophila DSM 6578]